MWVIDILYKNKTWQCQAFQAEDRAVRIPQRAQGKYIIWSVFQSNLMTNSLCWAILHCRYFPVIASWSHKWIPTNLILTSGGSFAVCSASLTTQYIQRNENLCHLSVIYIIVHDRVFSKGKLFDQSRMAVKRNTGPIGGCDLHPHMGEMCGKYAGLSIKILFFFKHLHEAAGWTIHHHGVRYH